MLHNSKSGRGKNTSDKDITKVNVQLIARVQRIQYEWVSIKFLSYLTVLLNTARVFMILLILHSPKNIENLQML